MTEDEKVLMRVVLCKPNEKAEVVKIEDNLEQMQALVGGLIQEYMPFHSESDPRYDDVAIVCNDEGKLMHMDLSRAITDEGGRVMDIIAGPFFICYAPLDSERFLSLPEDLEEEFLKKFEKPELFYRSENDIGVIRYDPKTREAERER